MSTCPSAGAPSLARNCSRPERLGRPEDLPSTHLVPAIARERPNLRLVVATIWRGANDLIDDCWREFAEVLRSASG
jgi:hypothetical protein